MGPSCAEPEVFGVVASDPTVSLVVDRLAADADGALAAVNRARAGCGRRRAATLRPTGVGGPDDPLVVDLDATLITARSEKEASQLTDGSWFLWEPPFIEAS